MSASDGRRGRELAALLLFLGVVFAQVAMEDGPLVALDIALGKLELEGRWPEAYPVAKAFELLGQRALVYAIALTVVGALAWAARTWRPLVILCGSLLTLNVVVGGTKLLTGRPKPFTGDLTLFEGGIIFPSGHAANVVLTWGIICYLLLRYGRWRLPGRLMAASVAVAAVGMGAASVYLNTHWLTDLVAGWLIGAAILDGAVIVDQRAPVPAQVPSQEAERVHEAETDGDGKRETVPGKRASGSRPGSDAVARSG